MVGIENHRLWSNVGTEMDVVMAASGKSWKRNRRDEGMGEEAEGVDRHQRVGTLFCDGKLLKCFKQGRVNL